MGTLTLVPDLLAKPGFRFTFRGPNAGDECDGCPVKGLCFKLEPGRTYAVDTVRDVTHPCGLHEGRMRVVTASRAPFETTVERKLLRGTAVTFRPIDCGYPECANWKLCHPAVQPDRYELAEAGAQLDCPMGHDIQRVTLR